MMENYVKSWQIVLIPGRLLGSKNQIFAENINAAVQPIVLTFPFRNTPLEEAKLLHPEKGDELEAMLDGLAEGGTLFRDIKPDVGKRCQVC